VEHGGGIPPAALLLVCFAVMAVGLAIALRGGDKKKKDEE
jgi:hypothetical protein